MRQIREILRLKFESNLSQRSIGDSCGISKTAVQECLGRAAAAGITWLIAKDLDDSELEAKLYPHVKGLNSSPLPDWSALYLELKKKGVTKTLLWQEYLAKTPGGLGRTQFCVYFAEWLQKQRLSMRQVHKAGEKLFVDFAGSTVPIHDLETGEVQEAQIFVAVWGASSFCYVEAVPSQNLPSWISCHVNAFEFFGCVPEVVVPDNLKSAIKNPCRYDPETNPTYSELASHYGFAVIPARARKPKDKAKVEAGVLLVTRWILAVLRHRKFFSLRELNDAIKDLLVKLNNRPFQKQSGSRQIQFDLLDRPAAKPLTQLRYTYAEVSKQRVNIDYHVVVGDHFYSVPYQLRGELVTIRVTVHAVEILYKNQRIFSHKRSYRKWQYTTMPEHMPEAHRAHGSWTPSRIIFWAEGIGPATGKLVTAIMGVKAHPEQGYRAWLGIYRLSRHYGHERVEAAAKRALLARKFRYTAVKEILLRGLDQKPLPDGDLETAGPIHHENIRGGEYYNNSAIEGENQC